MLNFPTDAITTFDRNETATDHLGTLILDNTDGHTRTILAVASQSKDARENTLYCGDRVTGTAFFDTMQSATTQFQRIMAYKCTLPIYSDTMRTSFIGMTYVDRDIYNTSPSSIGALEEVISFGQGTAGIVQIVDVSGSQIYKGGGISYEGIFLFYIIFIFSIFYITKSVINFIYGR